MEKNVDNNILGMKSCLKLRNNLKKLIEVELIVDREKWIIFNKTNT